MPTLGGGCEGRKKSLYIACTCAATAANRRWDSSALSLSTPMSVAPALFLRIPSSGPNVRTSLRQDLSPWEHVVMLILNLTLCVLNTPLSDGVGPFSGGQPLRPVTEEDMFCTVPQASVQTPDGFVIVGPTSTSHFRFKETQ